MEKPFTARLAGMATIAPALMATGITGLFLGSTAF